MQDFKYDRMMRSNAFMATDVRATGLKSLRQVIFEDFGTGMMVESLKYFGTVH